MNETPDQAAAPTSVRNIYFNGFQLALSNADITALLMLHNVPNVSVSMSYTTAKTLQQALAEMIDTLEKVTSREIMTTHQVGAGLEKLSEKDKPDGDVH